jgi:uncharacterized membrane protein
MRASLLAAGVTVAPSSLGAGTAAAQPPRFVVTDVGDLGGGEPVAASINAHGQVAAMSSLPHRAPAGSGDERRAFLWEDGVVVELLSLPGTRFGFAPGINDLAFVQQDVRCP